MSRRDRNQKDVSRVVIRLTQKLPRSAVMRKWDRCGNREDAVERIMEQNQREERCHPERGGVLGRAREEGGQKATTHAVHRERERSCQSSSKLSFM